jgi:hypothetical protein
MYILLIIEHKRDVSPEQFMPPTDVRNLVFNNDPTQADKRYDMSVSQFSLLKVARRSWIRASWYNYENNQQDATI